MHLLVQHDDTLNGSARIVRNDRIYVVTDDGAKVDISRIVKRVRPSLGAGEMAYCDLRIIKFQLEGMAEELRRDLDSFTESVQTENS